MTRVFAVVTGLRVQVYANREPAGTYEIDPADFATTAALEQAIFTMLAQTRRHHGKHAGG